MSIRVFFWWLLFLPIAVFFQALLPSVDVLLIGIILALQEKRYKDFIWILPLCILIQEGIGSRDFGGMLLWYTIVIVFFLIGRWLFEVQSLLFVFLLALCLGLAHLGLSYILAPLQDFAIDKERLLRDSLVQSVFIPFAWWIAMPTRRWTYSHEETA